MNRAFLFDWGDTLMRDNPTRTGPMWQWSHVSALPGALDVLQWAHAHGTVGIASGASESNEDDIRAALVRVGLARNTSAPFSAGRRWDLAKPILASGKALSPANLPPQKIIMIGDSFEADVAAPQATGIRRLISGAMTLPSPTQPSKLLQSTRQ